MLRGLPHFYLSLNTEIRVHIPMCTFLICANLISEPLSVPSTLQVVTVKLGEVLGEEGEHVVLLVRTWQ